MIMPGYWRRPEATAEAFWPGRWLRMGDVGRVVDGRLYLASRKRDLIFRGGENVYPVEIEHRLEAHPSVLEAAIVGVDHPELGQRGEGVRGAGRRRDASTAEELGRVVRRGARVLQGPGRTGRSAPEPLPRTATGKIVKAALDDPSLLTQHEEA